MDVRNQGSFRLISTSLAEFSLGIAPGITGHRETVFLAFQKFRGNACYRTLLLTM